MDADPGARHEATGSTLIVENTLFLENRANPNLNPNWYVGGAIWAQAGNLDISNSSFIKNRADGRCVGGFGCNVQGRGGAIYLGGTGTTTIANTHFIQNQAHASNGGDCFFGGSSFSLGGAIFQADGTLSMSNSVHACNLNTRTNCAPFEAGAALYTAGGSATLINVVAANNPNANAFHLSVGTMDIMNSIARENDEGDAQIGGTPTITYSAIQGGYDGEGNIPFNPAFANNDGCAPADFDLQLGSPAIDGGNPDTAHDDQCFPPSGASGTARNDMGAFGGPGACDYIDNDGDLSLDSGDNCLTFVNPRQTDTDGDNIGNQCDPDLDNNCIVTFGDLALLKSVFNPNPYDPNADFDGNGVVTFGDLARMKQLFFNGPTPGPGPSAGGCP